MTHEPGHVSNDDLVGGAITGDGYGGDYGTGYGGIGTGPTYQGPTFRQSYDPWQAQWAKRDLAPIKAWMKAGAPFDPSAAAASLQYAQARYKRDEAMAQQILADREAFVQVATRAHKIGKAYPYVPADVAYALAMGGHDDTSDATVNAAETAGIVSPVSTVTAIGDVPERKQLLTARAANEFATVNAEMGDAELLANLIRRGWQPDQVQTFNFDGQAFRTLTDAEVTASLRDVLNAEADVEDVDDGGSWLSDAAGGVFGVVKGASRWTTSFLFAPWEAYNSALRENLEGYEDGGLSNLEKLQAITGATMGQGWGEGWDETSFAEAVRQGVGPGGVESGTGWFMGGSVEASKTARDYFYYANQIGEEPATLGRASASMILKPGSEPFRIASGIVDAAGSLALDPSSYVPGGALAKGFRAIPGAGKFASARHALHWSDQLTTVPGVPFAPDVVDEALQTARTVAEPETLLRFPDPEQMPRMADEAGRVDTWAKRWYTGGTASGVRSILTGGTDDAASAGVKIRNVRRTGDTEPILMEFDPQGMTGYADTSPSTGWASEIKRQQSTQIIPNETLDSLKERLTAVHITEQIDPSHPTSDLLNSLVSDAGYRVVRRTIPQRDAQGAITSTRQITSLYRPDQRLPEGTRLSPFVDRVDTETGEIRSALTPGAENLSNPLGNWSDAVVADLGMGTFLTHFGEVRPLRTRELFDRDPIQAVTDAGMLNEIPDEGFVRVMYDTENLRGGVDTVGGEQQIIQSEYADVPDAAWPKPRHPGDFDEAKELQTATRQFESYIRKQRPVVRERALDQVEDLENTAGEGAKPGFLRTLSKPDQDIALTTGEVPLENLLNAWSPEDSESLARYMMYGPVPEDRITGVRAESTLAINDKTIDDAIYMQLPREKAEKILADWRAGKPVRVRTTAETGVRQGAMGSGQKKVRTGGGAKIRVQIPGINLLEDIEAQVAREFGDPDEIVAAARADHQARVAAWDDTPDAPTLYVSERADVNVKPGKGEAAYPDYRLFPSARTARTSSAAFDSISGVRAVSTKFGRRRAGRPARIADLEDREVADDLLTILRQEFEHVLIDRMTRLAEVPEDLLGAVDELEQALQAGDVKRALRAYEASVMFLPESQGQNAARATMHMDMLADSLRAQGYDAIKWTDESGEDVYEILRSMDWRYGTPKRAKTTDKATLVKESWDSQRFGVRLSGKQDELYGGIAAFDAPAVRPRNVSDVEWVRWQEQRQKLLSRGWTADETELGREVFRRPLAGEYDADAAQSLHKVLDEGDVTPGEYDDAGINLNGTRDVVVPEKFYDLLTKDKRVLQVLANVARTDSIEAVAKHVGWHQKPEVLARLTKADTVEKVRDVIIDAAGMRQIASLRIRGVAAERTRGLVDDALYHTPGFRRSLDEIRLLHVMPGQYVRLNDPEESFRQLHNWMMNARVPREQREKLLMEMAENVTSYGRKETWWAAFGVIEESIAQHLMRKGPVTLDETTARATARKMTELFKKDHNTHAEYHTKTPGIRGYVAGSQITDQGLVSHGPQILGDFFDGTLALPNPREIARVTGIVGRFVKTGTSVEKAMKFADAYNTVFKVTALARIAYPVRVLLEEQGRLYAAGLPNIYTHPIEYIMQTYVGRQGTDIMGRKWDDLAADPEPGPYANAMVTAKLLFENDNSVKFIGKNYTSVGPDSDQYLQGWMFNLGKWHSDPIGKRLVGKWSKDELAAMPDEIAEADNVQQVAWWLTNHDGGKKYLAAMLEATRTSMPDFHASLRQGDGVQRWVEELENQVRYITAQYEPALVEMLKTGRLKSGDKSEPIFVNSDRTRGAQVYNASTPNTGGFIDVLRNYTRLDAVPPQVITPDTLVSKGALPWRERAVTQMFSLLNGRPTNYLTRSPAFRAHYYERVAEHIRFADDEAVEWWAKRADEAKITPAQHRAIKKALKGRDPANSVLSASDIDQLAKGEALEFVEDLLYSTADKTHFWDAMRIVAPFGNAWAEVLSTWARLVVQNPKVLDRLAHGIHGAQQQDSNVVYDVTGVIHDADQGFFFKDLQSGDESFAWPMPPQVQPLVAAMFPAPVAGLNLIGQVQPGFGPVVTAAAGPLLDRPGWTEDVYNFIAPFGGPSVEDTGGFGNAVIDSVTPAWARKLLTAVYPITAEQKSALAAANLSSQTYLASTGRYDLNNPDSTIADQEADRLRADANTMARRLFFLRGIAQFVLPTMGGPEQVAKTGNGELVLQTKLASILRSYQSDPGEGGYGYQQGYLRFLRDYGSELYLMGVDRTDSTGYMAPTRQTYDWMRTHPGLTRRYPEVWGLLVDDPGSEFYYPAYQAQIRRGFRTLVNPAELIELANDRIARALYTSYRAQYPESLSETESSELQSLQDSLELRFPGYSRIPSELGANTNRIRQLSRAAADPEVQGLPVGASLQAYFAAREQLRRQGVSSFRTGLGRELAPQLWQLGETLAAQDETFAVAWDRLLSTEFDSEQFAVQEAA